MTAPDPRLSERFARALEWAWRLHREDARKATTIPYLAHLLNVCGLVLYDGGTEDQAIAALLHDALEDHPEAISADDIRREFGDAILAIVRGCTDTPPEYSGGEKPPWKARKRAYLAHLREAPPEVRRVSLADKLDNLRSVVADYRRLGEPFWARFHAGREEQLWYFQSLLAIFREVGLAGPMLDELGERVDELERLILSRS